MCDKEEIMTRWVEHFKDTLNKEYPSCNDQGKLDLELNILQRFFALAKHSGHLSGCTVSRLSRIFPDSWPKLTALYQNRICRSLRVSAVLEEIEHLYRETTNPVHQSTLPVWCTAGRIQLL